MKSKKAVKRKVEIDDALVFDQTLDKLLSSLNIRGPCALAVCQVLSALELAKCETLTLRTSDGITTNHLTYAATRELEDLVDDCGFYLRYG
jgi:hypothetical protein